MTDRVMQISGMMSEVDDLASQIANKYSLWLNLQQDARKRWAETNAYIFQTDTSQTSNRTLPHNNTTTVPKMAHLRDNLHSNYMAALFPNDKWLKWLAYDQKAATKETAELLENYMSNKLREGGFISTASRLVYDYIDHGNAFVMPSFERRYVERFGERIADYVGPKAIRISPYDIVFDPTASEFARTPKIIRSIKKLGDLRKLATIHTDHEFWLDVLERRRLIQGTMSGMTADDWEKSNQFQIDGFGSLMEYYGSEFVEILEFYGDWYNTLTGEFQQNRMITIVDRSVVVRNEEIETYSGRTPIFHVGWRLRPDNLWAMGPLDNLVGLQYRIDHLENAAADATDYVIQPMKMIVGEVEEFDWIPGGEIHIDEGGEVKELGMSMLGIATAESKTHDLEDRMELYAGAPREAMGIRTPGEKTAFEVDTLQTAAGRIFQEKATNIEINLFEPLFNAMIEISHRNFDGVEQVRVIDEEIGVTLFLDISKDDFTARGVLRPVGARHFAQQAQDLTNLNQLFNGPLGQMIAPHTSGVNMSKLVDDVLNLKTYSIFSPNVAVLEAQETQRIQNAAQEDLEVEQQGPVEGEELPEEDFEEGEEEEEGFEFEGEEEEI